MVSSALTRATYRVTEETLEDMVLEKSEFPSGFQSHQVVREGELDNERLARNGFAGSTAHRFLEAGRVTAQMRELGPTSRHGDVRRLRLHVRFGSAPVRHPRVGEQLDARYISEGLRGPRGRQRGPGASTGSGHPPRNQRLLRRVCSPQGAARRAPAGLISSTVVDFRLGRLLGVAFIGTIGDHQRAELTMQIGQALEKRMAAVVLGV